MNFALENGLYRNPDFDGIIRPIQVMKHNCLTLYMCIIDPKPKIGFSTDMFGSRLELYKKQYPQLAQMTDDEVRSQFKIVMTSRSLSPEQDRQLCLLAQSAVKFLVTMADLDDLTKMIFDLAYDHGAFNVGGLKGHIAFLLMEAAIQKKMRLSCPFEMIRNDSYHKEYVEMMQIATDEANSICSHQILIEMRNANSVDVYGMGSWPPMIVKEKHAVSVKILCFRNILDYGINDEMPNFSDAFPNPSDDATEENPYASTYTEAQTIEARKNIAQQISYAATHAFTALILDRNTKAYENEEDLYQVLRANGFVMTEKRPEHTTVLFTHDGAKSMVLVVPAFCNACNTLTEVDSASGRGPCSIETAKNAAVAADVATHVSAYLRGREHNIASVSASAMCMGMHLLKNNFHLHTKSAGGISRALAARPEDRTLVISSSRVGVGSTSNGGWDEHFISVTNRSRDEETDLYWRGHTSPCLANFLSNVPPNILSSVEDQLRVIAQMSRLHRQGNDFGLEKELEILSHSSGHNSNSPYVTGEARRIVNLLKARLRFQEIQNDPSRKMSGTDKDILDEAMKEAAARKLIAGSTIWMVNESSRKNSEKTPGSKILQRRDDSFPRGISPMGLFLMSVISRW